MGFITLNFIFFKFYKLSDCMKILLRPFVEIWKRPVIGEVGVALSPLNAAGGVLMIS